MFVRSTLGLVLLCIAASAWGGSVVIPSDVAVHLVAEPNSELVTGQPVVFTLSVTNHGPEIVPTFVATSSQFTSEFNLGLGTSDCQHLGLVVADGKTVYYSYNWIPTFGGPIGIGETRTCHLTLPVGSAAPDMWTFGLYLPSSYQDLNPANNVSVVTLRRGVDSARAIPTLSSFALLSLAILLVAAAASARRTRV